MRHHIRIILSALLLLSVFHHSSAASWKKKVTVDPVGLNCRGVMESFPAVAEDIEARLDFYRAEGLTHYFYCPSDDRYCNRWGWKILYNDSDRHLVRKLNSLCRDKGLDFVWTLNPGERYGWNEQDYGFLRDKLVMMYYNGIRSFAVDFTDNPGPHQAVRDSLLKHLPVNKKEKVSLYIIDDIPEVEYPSEGQSAVETLMRGYHFDDHFRSSAQRSDAVICNIASSDEFAKLAVVASSDFARDPDSYSPYQSMADAVKILHGDVRDAFITFLRHTGTVDESSSVETFSLSAWSKEKSDTLYKEFDKIEKVPELIGGNTDSEVLEALQPWLQEFGRLGTRGKNVLQCMEYYVNGNLGPFWKTYLGTVMSESQIASYNSHPVGADKLHPFCMRSLADMKEGFATMLSGGTQLHNLASTLYARPNAALDSDFETSVSTCGHMEFAIPAIANTCHLLTGPLPKDKRILFRQLATDGSLVAEFIVRSPYTTFDLKSGAVKVDVMGDIEIYETIFVDLQP